MGDQQGRITVLSGQWSGEETYRPPTADRSMKIIEITNVDFSLRQFLLPLMRGIRARGHEVIGVCAEGSLLDGVRAEGFRVLGVPFARRLTPLAHVRAFCDLVRLFRAERPDLVHAHMPISGFLARVAAKVARVPRVAYTCHGFLFKQEGSWPRRSAGFIMEWIGGHFTDVFMTVSATEADEAKRLYIFRTAKAIGNGRDPAVFRRDSAARERIRTTLGTPADRVVIVAVSRLVRAKGYPELAAAMREVPDAELWVVGERLESDRGDDVRALLTGAGLGERLRLLGYRDDVAAVLAAADIFVLPSYFEGLPMSVIEAMLTGLPVVASDIEGPREQVVPGVTGLLVPPRRVAPLANALRLLAADRALRAAMGTAGRERAVQLYDEARVVERTLDLLGLEVYPAR
jgi:glycosyltransferase involved in cell wall biosynthesis